MVTQNRIKTYNHYIEAGTINHFIPFVNNYEVLGQHKTKQNVYAGILQQENWDHRSTVYSTDLPSKSTSEHKSEYLFLQENWQRLTDKFLHSGLDSPDLA